MNSKHYQALEDMYLSAPINKFYMPDIQVKEGQSQISIDIKEDFFHAGSAVHGSCYFKQLDDAAFFAAASLEEEYFVLTTSFTTYLTRPISAGKMIAKGKVVNMNKSFVIYENIRIVMKLG